MSDQTFFSRKPVQSDKIVGLGTRIRPFSVGSHLFEGTDVVESLAEQVVESLAEPVVESLAEPVVESLAESDSNELSMAVDVVEGVSVGDISTCACLPVLLLTAVETFALPSARIGMVDSVEA